MSATANLQKLSERGPTRLVFDRKHEFTLIAVGLTDLDEVPLGKVLEVGCDDSTVGSSRGRVHFDFSREAPTLDQAIGSAIRALKKAGIDPYLESVHSPEKGADVA